MIIVCRICLATLGVLVAVALRADTITVSNASGQSGVLVTGRTLSGVDRRHHPFPIAQGQTSVTVEDFVASSITFPEIVAFGENAAPVRKNASWTDVDDDENLSLGQARIVPLVFWILGGAVPDKRIEANVWRDKADCIYKTERTGVSFGPVGPIQVEREVPESEAQSFLDFSGDFLALAAAFPPKSGHINVYVVDKVKGNGRKGISNFSNMIVMSKNAAVHLLSHELGHAMSLHHTDYVTGFSARNLMFEASTDRRFVSEGQTFRMHFNISSFLGGGDLVCSTVATDKGCSPADRRIWPEGPGCQPAGPPVLSPTEDIESDEYIVRDWLLQDCAIDEAPDPEVLKDRLKNLGNAGVQKLWIAYTHGPSQDIEKYVRSSLTNNYWERRAWVERTGPSVLGKGEAEKLLEVTEEEFIMSRMEEWRRSSKEAALRGLAVIGNAKAIEKIKFVLKNDKDFSPLAKKLLSENFQ